VILTRCQRIARRVRLKAGATSAVVAGLVTCAAALSCAGGPPEPAEWVSGAYQCQFCRMTVVDRRFASQIVKARDEPRFFDDLGCLANYLAKTAARADDTALYVADHRTGEWVRAHEAVYARVDGLSAPMGSHIVAHASAVSREADVQAAAGVPVAIADVLPASWSGGTR
jgi:copper chaperone NosL